MRSKYLILLTLLVPFVAALGQTDASAPAVTPAAAALEQARTHVRNGEKAAAVEVLATLAGSGFTAVNAISGDAELATLSGTPEFDTLIASMTAQAFPCEHNDEFRQFDFWLGEWDVHVAGGALAGHNLITSEQRGCYLNEAWTSATGGTGSSINYLDKATDEWVQIWNDASGNQIHIRGGLADNGMFMQGTIHYVANDSTLPFRALWTPLEDGRVRQFFEQSNDGGKTWVAWFEGFYSRKAQAAN